MIIHLEHHRYQISSYSRVSDNVCLISIAKFRGIEPLIGLEMREREMESLGLPRREALG